MVDKLKTRIKSVERAFDIIQSIKSLNGASVTEISEELNIPISTTHNHLSTLQKKGYLVKDGDKYKIALRFIHLGDHAKHRLSIYKVGKQNVYELARESGEMANLLVEEHGRGVYVAVERSDRALRLDSYVLQREFLHCTALGKAILAHKNRSEVDDIIDLYGLPRMTSNTITDKEELHKELQVIRDRGYAFDNDERMEGLQCVAAPILDANSYPLGAVSVSGPKSRLNGNVLKSELPRMVRNTANAIEIDIRHL